jgi:hypothetical protein
MVILANMCSQGTEHVFGVSRGNYPFEGEDGPLDPWVYHSVSRKWLQGYLNEYAWRYNRRENPQSMFHDLLAESVSRAV